MLDTETLLRRSDPNITGMFMLEKCVFLVEGETTGDAGIPRCDNAFKLIKKPEKSRKKSKKGGVGQNSHHPGIEMTFLKLV